MNLEILSLMHHVVSRGVKLSSVHHIICKVLPHRIKFIKMFGYFLFDISLLHNNTIIGTENRSYLLQVTQCTTSPNPTV